MISKRAGSTAAFIRLICFPKGEEGSPASRVQGDPQSSCGWGSQHPAPKQECLVGGTLGGTVRTPGSSRGENGSWCEDWRLGWPLNGPFGCPSLCREVGGGTHRPLSLDRVALLSVHTDAQCVPPGGPGPWLRNWPLAVGGLLDSTRIPPPKLPPPPAYPATACRFWSELAHPARSLCPQPPPPPLLPVP